MVFIIYLYQHIEWRFYAHSVILIYIFVEGDAKMFFCVQKKTVNFLWIKKFLIDKICKLSTMMMCLVEVGLCATAKSLVE